MTPILVCRKLSKLEEASRRKRNSQDDTLPRSKINTETESPLQSFMSGEKHWRREHAALAHMPNGGKLMKHRDFSFLSLSYHDGRFLPNQT